MSDTDQRPGGLEEPRETYLAPVREWFGFTEEMFADYRLYRYNARIVGLVSRGIDPPSRPEPASVGMPFLRVDMVYPKMTTAGAMAFGHRARRNTIDIDRGGAEAFLRRKRFEPDEGLIEGCEPRGYVLVRHAGMTLGVGFLEDDEEERTSVRSFFPKKWALESDRTLFGGG